MNKLTLKDQFLSLEQAKELQELGIDFSNSSMGFFKGELKFDYFPVGNKSTEHIPTLSVAEMLEMLPKCIEVKDVLYELYLKKSSFYIGDMAYELGYKEYLNESLSINEYTHALLRNSLFEMLKWLKQNKLM